MPRFKARTCCGFIWIFAFVLFATASPRLAQSPPSWFWGCWVVTKSLPTAGISGISQKQADAIIGTRILFAPTCARSGRTIIQSPKYSVKTLSARDFFKLGYFPLSQIGIHEQQVTQVALTLPDNLSDLDFPGSEVYLREKDIVINVENHSFLAVRAKPGDAACACEAPEARSDAPGSRHSAPGLAQDSAQYRACNDEAKTQGEMNACASEEAARVDTELNTVYRKLLSKAASQPEAVAKIKASERAWITYRDAYMEAMYPAKDKQAQYGSVYPMEADLLKAKLTRQQVAAVEEMLKQYSGT